MKSHFAMFAAYNRWANGLIYKAAARLSPQDYHADRGAFFKSVHGTLSHLVVTDRIWLGRFTGQPSHHKRLDEQPYADFDSLTNARKVEDERLIAYVEGLTDKDIAASFTFTPITNPTPVTQPVASALSHLFNHQTHHRGQAHCLLTTIAGPGAGPLMDLTYFQRLSGVGMS